jgi:ubiquinone/menaquinone biosynthesis C-methylase UbiE
LRLAEREWSVPCIDVNEDSLRICKLRIPDATCLLAKPQDRTIPADDGTFKLILCIEVEPVLHSQWFLDEAHRVLADGGCIVTTMTNRSSLRAIPHHVLESFRDKSQRLSPELPSYTTSYRAWRETLSRKGFTLLRSEGCCWFPFQRNSNSGVVSIATKLESVLGIRTLVPFSPWIVSVARKEA